MGAIKFRIPRPPSLAGLQKALAPTLQPMGEWAIGCVQARTAAGVDKNGQAFRPYTPAYAKRRQKLGLSTTPDLIVTGQMLESLSILRTTDFGVVLGFVGINYSRPMGNRLDLQHHQKLIGLASGAYGRKASRQARGAAKTILGVGSQQILNSDLAARVSRLRPFLGLTEGDKQRLVAFLRPRVLAVLAQIR